MAAAVIRRNPRLKFSLFKPFSTAAAISTPKPSPSPSLSDPSDASISRAKSAIRSETNPDRVAKLFQSAAHSPLFYGDRQIFRHAITKLARARRPDLVERLLDHQLSHPSTPKSEGFLVRVITLYSEAGMVDHAVKTFDSMPALGCARHQRALSGLLTVFLKNKQFDRLREAFETVPKELNISPGITAHNILLQGLCLEGKLDDARKLLDEMTKKGVKPDIVSLNTVLNGYLKKGDENGFEEVLKEINKRGLEASAVTYNCRIAKLCGKGRSFEGEEMLDVMVKKGVKPNRLSFNTVISGFCKEGDMGAAMRVYKRMQDTKKMDAGASPNFETYIVLIQGLVAKEEFDTALEICKECVGRKWAPPFLAVKGLIEGLVKNSKSDEAIDLVGKMRKAIKGDAMDAWKKIEGSLSLQDKSLLQ